MIENPEFFKRMYDLIQHRKKAVRKESILILTNIACGTERQRKKMFQSFPFVEKLVSCIFNDVDEVNQLSFWKKSTKLDKKRYSKCIHKYTEPWKCRRVFHVVECWGLELFYFSAPNFDWYSFTKTQPGKYLSYVESWKKNRNKKFKWREYGFAWAGKSKNFW